MMKRFSIKAFIVATLIHLAATWWVFTASERAYAEWRRTGVEIHSVWLAVIAWILQPVALCVSHYPWLVRYFPWSQPTDPFDLPSPTIYFLPWTLFVGVCFGFLVPRISRWRHRSSNQTIQGTDGSLGS